MTLIILVHSTLYIIRIRMKKLSYGTNNAESYYSNHCLKWRAERSQISDLLRHTSKNGFQTVNRFFFAKFFSLLKTKWNMHNRAILRKEKKYIHSQVLSVFSLSFPAVTTWTSLFLILTSRDHRRFCSAGSQDPTHQRSLTFNEGSEKVSLLPARDSKYVTIVHSQPHEQIRR